MLPRFGTGHSAQCSICAKPINVHQQVRGGTCDDTACRTAAVHRWVARQHAEEEAMREAVARTHLPTLLAGRLESAAEVAVVVVSGAVSALQPMPMERRENLRESVTQAVLAAATTELPAIPAPLPAADTQSAVLPVAAICGTCRGFCCRSGGDSAYIDAGTVSRVRAQRPELDEGELVARYVDAIPERSVERSCIFHGEEGCALPRELRSQTCNNYFCRPVQTWMDRSAQAAAHLTAAIIVHENRVVRSSLIEGERKAADT